MTDNTIVLAFNDELAKCETEANKIRFRQETYKSLSKLAGLKGMSKKLTVKSKEKELAEAKEESKFEMTDAMAQKIARLEMQLDFIKTGVTPSAETVDEYPALVKARPLKVNEDMDKGIRTTSKAIKLKSNELGLVSKDEQELIEGLIGEELSEEKEEPVVEQVEEAEAVEEVATEEKPEDYYIKLDNEESLKVPFDIYKEAKSADEEDLEEQINPQYEEVDAKEEVELDESVALGLTEDEVKSVKTDIPEEEPEVEEKEEKIDTLEEVELLFKEAEDVKQQVSDVSNERKQAEEKIAKEEEKRKEAQKLKETRDKALKEAVAKYRENIKKEQEKIAAERKAKEEAEKRAKAISEETKAIEDRTKATDRAIEMLLEKMDTKEEEKKVKKK